METLRAVAVLQLHSLGGRLRYSKITSRLLAAAPSSSGLKQIAGRPSPTSREVGKNSERMLALSAVATGGTPMVNCTGPSV